MTWNSRRLNFMKKTSVSNPVKSLGYISSAAAQSNLSKAIVLWCVISTKLDIGKKITGSEIMTLNRKKIQHVSRLMELMFKWEFHCLQGGYRNQTGRKGV